MALTVATIRADINWNRMYSWCQTVSKGVLIPPPLLMLFHKGHLAPFNAISVAEPSSKLSTKTDTARRLNLSRGPC